MPAAEAGSRIASLALLHGYDALPKDRLIAFMSTELEVYGDESYEADNDFVIGGWIGPAIEWLKLEEPWREALRKAGLSEYHARDCEQGEKEYKDRTDRLELQERFIDLIRSVNVMGFATRVDLHGYDTLLERIRAARPKDQHGFFEVYPKAVEMELQLILKFVGDAFPGATRVNFTFDRGDQFAFKAGELIDRHRTELILPNRHLIGAVSFGVSKDLVPLQAADLFAYEVHRELRNVHGAFHAGWNQRARRWQAARLDEGGRVKIAVLDEEGIADWASKYPEVSG